MEPTNRRKFAVSILALGVVALVVDRFVLGPGESGPATASAEAVPAAKSAVAAARAPARCAETSLAERLKAIASDLDRTDPVAKPTEGPPVFSDAFAVPVSWRPAAPSNLSNHDANAKPTDPLLPELKLTSISSVLVVISGVKVKAGETIDFGEGASKCTLRLVSIDREDRKVVVQANGKFLTLELASALTSK
ncbi:hypothetical protein PHYC_02589 [Phycisphaerales bacterium]|nr:hypothetical protein PHYC_02589 [Phycisphaerales bacterium]